MSNDKIVGGKLRKIYRNENERLADSRFFV